MSPETSSGLWIPPKSGTPETPREALVARERPGDAASQALARDLRRKEKRLRRAAKRIARKRARLARSK